MDEFDEGYFTEFVGDQKNEKYHKQIIDEEGKFLPESIFQRFLMRMQDVLEGPARRNGQNIDVLLTIFNAILYYSHDDIERISYDSNKNTSSDEAPENKKSFINGLHIFFQQNMLKHLGDFILQDKSPWFREKSSKGKEVVK